MNSQLTGEPPSRKKIRLKTPEGFRKKETEELQPRRSALKEAKSAAPGTFVP